MTDPIARNPLAVPALEQVVGRGEAHMALLERQAVPSLKEAVIVSLVCTAVGVLLGSLMLPLLIVFLFVPIICGAIFMARSSYCSVGIVAFPHYFVVLRSKRRRLPAHARRASLEGPGELVAILNKSDELRPEERAESPAVREITVFAGGRSLRLLFGILNQDESLEALFQLRAFLDRHRNQATASPAKSEPVLTQPPSNRRSKGTLS